MRIGFDAKRLFNNFTGLGNYSRFVVDALSQYYADHEYWLYTPKIKNHSEVGTFLDPKRFIIRQPKGWVQSAFSAYWRSISLGREAIADGISVFHGLSNELPLTKPRGLKTIVTVHDLIFKRLPAYYSAIDILIYSWKLRHACKSADCIVAVSHQTAKDLKEFIGVDERKLVVIHQGCHSIFKKSYPDELVQQVKTKYNLPPRFILTVGTIERRKNAILLIKALSLIKEKIPLVLVGKPTDYLSEVQSLTDELRLRERVFFIHHATFQDLSLLYQAAELFVYPSVFEGFGIPILEAIASGLPVISSNGSCFYEAGGPNSIYVNPSNADELADEIHRLWGNSDLRTEMVTKSREYIKRFEPEVIAGQLIEVYKKLNNQ